MFWYHLGRRGRMPPTPRRTTRIELREEDVGPIHATWIGEAGMSAFVPPAAHYRPVDESGLEVVELSRVDVRCRRLQFSRKRFIRVVEGFRCGTEIPAIRVAESGDRFLLIDGLHRYHGSRAAGFTHIPIVVVTA
jgi:hypothetical protein